MGKKSKNKQKNPASIHSFDLSIRETFMLWVALGEVSFSRFKLYGYTMDEVQELMNKLDRITDEFPDEKDEELESSGMVQYDA